SRLHARLSVGNGPEKLQVWAKLTRFGEAAEPRGALCEELFGIGEAHERRLRDHLNGGRVWRYAGSGHLVLTNHTGHADTGHGKSMSGRGAVARLRYFFPVLPGSGLPETMSRSQRRWCRHAQPPVTLPRVMALIVPRTQIAA